ncbi:MAG: FIST signal transduction protein [Solirubrobacteraceae bacterium]
MVRIGSGLSTAPDARVGAIEAATTARQGLGGERADLVAVFASGRHLAAPEATLEGIHEGLKPRQVIGCGAAGVLADGHEIEGRTAVAVWAAALGDGSAELFHAVAEQREESVAITGVPDLDGADAAVLLADPSSFPTDLLLRELAVRAPGVPVVGGLSSARTLEDAGALFFGEELVEGGAVGIRFDGVDILPCVSQGAAPIGPELAVTAAEGHVVHELAGRPALAKVREVIEALDESEQAMVARGLLIGIVTDEPKRDYGRGDFLVRALLGADPMRETFAVGETLRRGQIIRLHARDAASADRDLRESLELRARALGGPAAGALVFTCNGRGQAMFGHPDHDVGALEATLPGAAAAGFFAAGEIGPVGGESYLHGFTATIAIFGS